MFTKFDYSDFKDDDVTVYDRPSNERLLPTTDDTLGEKKFLYGLWMYLQSISKGSVISEYSYVNVKEMNCSVLAKKITFLSKVTNTKEYYNKTITRQTVAKGIRYLIEKEFIVEIVEGN